MPSASQDPELLDAVGGSFDLEGGDNPRVGDSFEYHGKIWVVEDIKRGRVFVKSTGDNRIMSLGYMKAAELIDERKSSLGGKVAPYHIRNEIARRKR